MNKKNKIFVGCLSLLLALSVGYALFSDTITINGTATAKGSFDIIATCQKGVPSELISGVHNVFDDAVEIGYKNDECSFVDDEGTFKVEFDYPGALRYFTVKMTNDGTIPAILGEPSARDAEACFDLDGSGTYEERECSSTSPYLVTVYPYATLFSGVEVAGVQVGDGPIIPYDQITEELGAEFMDSNGNYMLKPGNSVFWAIKTNLDSRVGDDGNNKFMAITEATFEFPFTQVTQ